jgi:hypothetical protein
MLNNVDIYILIQPCILLEENASPITVPEALELAAVIELIPLLSCDCLKTIIKFDTKIASSLNIS